LTIAVQAQPGISAEYLEAIDNAITTWAAVLEDCFDGLITLTQVDSRREADIVLHYVAHAGGAVFAGFAVCGDHGCPNILVSSEAPPSWGQEPYSPELLGWITLHELGHALGLGHATNLEENTDLMGYGWPDLGDPVLSDCDLDALAFIFAWALEGVEPYPPADGPYDCSTS
jgi:predicted Zn-dependent protease